MSVSALTLPTLPLDLTHTQNFLLQCHNQIRIFLSARVDKYNAFPCRQHGSVPQSWILACFQCYIFNCYLQAATSCPAAKHIFSNLSTVSFEASNNLSIWAVKVSRESELMSTKPAMPSGDIFKNKFSDPNGLSSFLVPYLATYFLGVIPKCGTSKALSLTNSNSSSTKEATVCTKDTPPLL